MCVCVCVHIHKTFHFKLNKKSALQTQKRKLLYQLKIYRQEYQTGGYKMLSVVNPDGSRLVRQSLLFCLLLIPTSLLLTVFGITGKIYLFGGLFLGLFLFIFFCFKPCPFFCLKQKPELFSFHFPFSKVSRNFDRSGYFKVTNFY